MPKRKKSKKTQTNTKLLTYLAWFLALIALVLSALLSGYYIGFSDGKDKTEKIYSAQNNKQKALLKKLENSLNKKPISVSKRLKSVLKKETKQYISASHEIDGSSLASVPKMAKRKKVITPHKARLAIIIDDVGTKSQVEAIKSLRLPLTMSFLPPSKARPNSAKLAKLENLYMVHLPMEAQNWSAEEPNTLRIHDKQNRISARIKEIKQLFPKVKYINNHTGSKFTSNEVAMNRLIFALNANKIHFIDSRTTAQTKAPKVLKNFGLKYVSRDVFLDHHMDKPYVLEQIKKAIQVAKSHGTAIAIGHPHKNTLQALYESKELLKDVELVYINRL
ncbi:divergent polysaccharide deacetylase family protein [Sulfurimonas sp. SAG-AH-194-C21]|nr:divergent polysaccharide deacetylase family protein [Sulfurimonas sp. SAG-AH-194-C21]MDF1883563.1 divergent polysaccharide deacetylase family protein [Sulfurimonas sp. SAG-AH-194-C21]